MNTDQAACRGSRAEARVSSPQGNRSREARGAACSIIAMLVVVCGVSSVARRANGGPWSKNLGQAYVKLAESVFFANNFVDQTGREIDGVSYLGVTTALYGEVGLYRRLHASLYLPFTHGRNDFGNAEYTRNALGDAVLALQYTLPVPWAFPLLAVRGELKLPLYGIDKDLFEDPAPGDGQIDATFWLSAGGSLSSLPLYGFVELGYRTRTEVFLGDDPDREFHETLTLASQIGYTFFQRLLVGLNVVGVFPLATNAVTKGYLVVGPSLYVPIVRGLALEASFDPMLYAKSATRGYGVSFGVSYATP